MKSAWGLYGKDDELGFLNRQTDEIVTAAAKSEIQTGVRWVGSLPKFSEAASFLAPSAVSKGRESSYSICKMLTPCVAGYP